MFNTELFPTPVPVITRMLSPWIKQVQNQKYISGKPAIILEPHGGSGAILDYMVSRLNAYTRELFTLEIDPELRLILQGKGYRVIGSDFLAYNEPVRYDLVVMNPPFSNGVKHVLKGIEVLNDGGRLVALLNAESLHNPCTKERVILLNHLAMATGSSFQEGDDVAAVLEALEAAGQIEWLGQCFNQADRPTDVEVVLVRLQLSERVPDYRIDADRFEHDQDLDEQTYHADPLAHRNAVKNLVVRYQAAQQILVERHQAQAKLDFYLDGICRPVYESVRREDKEVLAQEKTLVKQLTVLKSRFWSTVFEKTQMGTAVTSGYRQKFDQIAIQQAAMAFSEQNIQELLMGFFANRSEIMRECVAEVFDKATRYHDKNIVHNEGWKTNQGHRINKRIIMPYGVECQWGFSACFGIRDFLNDLDRVLCWLSGTPLKTGLKTYSELDSACNDANKHGYNRDFFSPFFKFRFYKKGTLHLDFLDLELLEDFNVVACQQKKWLGYTSGYKTKREKAAAQSQPKIEVKQLPMEAVARQPLSELALQMSLI